MAWAKEDLIECHNPYFNRWFSAIKQKSGENVDIWNRHNPYFNRWFSAIKMINEIGCTFQIVTILILIDGFLQSPPVRGDHRQNKVTILILIDGFLQCKYTIRNGAP